MQRIRYCDIACILSDGSRVIQAAIPLQVVRKHYGPFAKEEATLPVSFSNGEITLHIPAEGLVTEEGWRITPFSHPTVSKA